MLVALSWLKQYLNTDASVTEIAEKLTAIGLEVENVEDTTSGLKDFIVGEIKSKEKHPNADKLNILTVWTGVEDLQIVCGAPNCYVGMKSVLAKVGTLIPHYGEKLEKGVIRGIESFGMLCSERELGIGDDHSGILDLKTEKPAGTPITDIIQSEVVFDVNVTPNRGDCFGIKGIARDLAATGIGEFVEQEVNPVPGTFQSPINVRIEDEDCPQFVGRYIRGVKNVESPDWLKNRLIAVGLRPISALVDITNYLNIGECRPLHVFDADKVVGDLIVRSAKDGETLKALDEQEYTLRTGMTVIADNNGAQSIAGVMGGEATGCSADTVNVFLESAYFLPLSIASTGRLLNAESDSRSRFERGVDPASAVLGNEIATRLILDICGGEASEMIIAGQEPKWQHSIDFDFGLVQKLIGMEIPQNTMIEILKKLGFTVCGNLVQVPSWRTNDVKLPADLVEEIVRIYGLDNLPEAPMRSDKPITSVLNLTQRREVVMRRTLASRGLNQAITYSFMDSKLAQLFDSKGIKIANPIASDLDEMRPSLIPNLLSAVKRNQDRGITDVQLFEVGPEFYSTIPTEQRLVACGIRAGSWTQKHWSEKNRDVDVFDAKADALEGLASMGAPQTQTFRKAPSWYHPGRSGSLCLGKNILAHFGEIHPAVLKAMDIKTPVVGFEIYMDAIPEAKTQKSKLQKKIKLSNLMPLTRDFAFVMDKEVEAERIVNTIKGVDKEKITAVSVFDVYTGSNLPEDKKSLAVKVHIQPTEKTLTDADIEILSTQIINMVKKNTNAELRN